MPQFASWIQQQANGHASNAERAGDFYARIAGADAWGPVRAAKEEIGRTEKVKSVKGQLETVGEQNG
jgi:hypothetical protein